MRRLVAFLGMSVLVVSGCSLLPQLETPVPTLVPTTPAPTLDPSGDVARAQAAWNAAGIHDYTWHFSVSCECEGMDVEVTVADGKVTRVRTPTKELKVADMGGYLLTVDDVLREAARASLMGGTVQGTWRSNGVPDDVYINPSNAIDGGDTIGVISFDPAP